VCSIPHSVLSAQSGVRLIFTAVPLKNFHKPEPWFARREANLRAEATADLASFTARLKEVAEKLLADKKVDHGG
jgi:hypothetical protein